MCSVSRGAPRASWGHRAESHEPWLAVTPPRPGSFLLGSSSLPVKSVASSKDAFNLPHSGALFTKQRCCRVWTGAGRGGWGGTLGNTLGGRAGVKKWGQRAETLGKTGD